MMNVSAKGTEKQEKDDVIEPKAVVEERKPASEIALTVRARDQQWRFHCREDQPLANTLFVPLENTVGGKCLLQYESVTNGNTILDRKKTPSFYGMIYDDIIYLGAIIRPCESI